MYKDKKTQIAIVAVVLILLTSAILFCSGINFGPVSAVRKKTKKISSLESASINNSYWTILTSPLNGNYGIGNYKLTSVNSPYIVVSNIDLTDNSNLYIEPGVEIKFSGSYSFSFAGNITAVGTSASPIKFTSNQVSPSSGDYKGIMLGSDERTVDINYIIFEYSTVIHIHGNNSSKVTDCTFKSNNNGEIYSFLNGQIKYCNIERGINIQRGTNISYCNISNKGIPTPFAAIFVISPPPQFKLNNCNLEKTSNGYVIQYNDLGDSDITNNWWNTTISTTIASYNYNPSGPAGIFNYQPFLISPVSNAGPQ